jgi:hypothetical protein
MNMGRIVLASVLVCAVLGAAGVMIAYRAWHTTEQVEQVVIGPDSTHIARVISVHEPAPNGRRYVVVRVGRVGVRTDARDDSGAVWLENARDVAASWTGPKRLVVQYTGHAYIEGKVQRVGDVRVTYLAVDSIGATPVPTRDTTRPASTAGSTRPPAGGK